MNHFDYHLPTTRFIYKLALSLALFGLLSFSPPFIAQASGPIVVNSPADSIADDGFCTLPEAIIAANDDVSSGESTGECIAEDGADTIQFSVTGTIDLSDTLPEITGDLDIEGPGATDLTIRRYNETDFRLFTIASETEVTIAWLTLADGNLPSANGGAINNNGDLLVLESVFEDNFSTAGGAIFNAGSLTVDQTTFRNNGGHSGGAIYSTGTTEINNSTFSGNQATANDGGAIFAGGGTVTISNSTVSANSAVQYGGGLVTSADTPSTVNVFNSTFYGNSAGYSGGGLSKFQGTISLKNTIVAASPSGGNCSGSLTSLGYNLSSDNSCGFSASGDQQNVDPLLGSLADNGGFSQTHALLADSPAIDAGDPAFASPPDNDQRGSGFPRIVNDRVDMGAFETEALEATDSAQAGPTFIVNTSDDVDDGVCGTEHCSLREAVRAANAAAGPNTITLSNDTYTLILAGADEDWALTGDLDITDDLVISGVGPQDTIVDADELDRVFDIRPEVAAVTFSNMTIRGGDVYGEGGGIRNAQADLGLEDVIVTDNSSSGGGSAIFNSEGSLTLTSQGDFGQIDDVIWSDNGLSKSGSGKYTLTGDNSYQGITYINEGVLCITHAQALGPQTPDAANGTVVADGATLILHVETSGAQFQEPLTLNGTGFDGGGALLFLNAIAVSEEIGLATDSAIGQYDQSTSTNIGAEISGPGSLTKVGPGGLHLSYAATYTGQTIIEAGFISVGLAGGVIPDPSPVTIAEGASLNLYDNDETIASLAGAGNVFLGSGSLTTGNADSTTFSGIISGSGGLTKVGNGAFTLSGVNTYQGLTSVSEGSLFVDGVVAGDVIADYSTLGGSGTILGAVSASENGVVSPGPGPAILKTGPLDFSAGTTYAVEIGGETPGEAGYDQLEVSGTVWLDPTEPGVSLSLEFVDEFSPSAGAEFVIIKNDGNDAINGSFAELAEGTVFDSNFGGSGQSARITYLGGDGNDVAIIVGALQTGPIFTVNTSDDPGEGECTPDHCSLREAIAAANASPNQEGWDEIHFEIPGSGPHTISPAWPLPNISESLIIDGLSQTGASCSGSPLLQIELDGSLAETEGTVDGLRLFAGDSIIRGLAINNFSGNGLTLSSYGGNYVECNLIGLDVDGQTAQGNGENGVEIAAPYNTIGGSVPGTGNVIASNGLAGVLVTADKSNNAIRGNSIYSNTNLGIDLGGDGVTVNDTSDVDLGSNKGQNFPVFFRATPSESSTQVEGRLNSLANHTFALDFFANESCDPSKYGEGQSYLGAVSVTTDANGDVIFAESLPAVPDGQFISATATDSYGNTSEFAQCVAVGPDNDSWPRALRLNPNNETSFEQLLDMPDQSRWYKFSVEPNSEVQVTLTNLPANYDLTIYKDIAQAYEDINSPQDLTRLSAEFAPSAFSPSAFSPSAFSPSAFSPSAFSPSAFSPSAFSPSAFSPSAFSPSAFSPSAFSPSAFSPSAFSPSAFSPSAFSPSAFSPSAFSPSAFSPSAFSSAQTRSLIGISAFEGRASEGILLNTWNNAGDFYIRVRGRNGVFDLNNRFRLEIKITNEVCGSLAALPSSSLSATGGDYETIILTDLNRNTSRMGGTATEKNVLIGALGDLAAQTEVKGVVVDVGADARVAAANIQADANPACPYAKNVVAEAIKNIVDDYRSLNPNLTYIVLIGNDEIIPFFRYPDTSLLGNEENYVPPVLDFTASQASLRLGYVLSQDAYGSSLDISFKANTFPIPDLAVGRLVETAPEITGMIGAYLNGTNAGVVPTPSSALVTGYDFLEDAALSVQDELEAGLNTQSDSLIAAQNLAPELGWTAQDLSNLLLQNRYDVVFLAGHFSANSALAADYNTSLVTTEFVASPVDMTNAIVFSAGCHSGYNIVNEHGVPGVTLLLDWPQAFAQKQATLIAGTGYQYGDTDFIEYSERIYLEFSRQLRVGQPGQAVSIGQALVAAKQTYLNETPKIEGLHEKALLEATIFGLPMLSVVMPGERINETNPAAVVGSTNSFSSEPGATLGLEFSNLTLNPDLTSQTQPLKNVDDNTTLTATYLSGKDGTLTNPIEPTLPLEVFNVSAPNGKVLRGVGFRGGQYVDLSNIMPLTGAPATEIRGVHGPFMSEVFFPIRPWFVNYFDALQGGSTQLMVTPAQHQSSGGGSQSSTLRRFDELNLRLFYSSNTTKYAGDSMPALAAAPAISKIAGVPEAGSVNFRMEVVGNPAAGIQEVWITYTDLSQPFPRTWQSLDLTQNATNSTVWEGSLALNGTDPDDIRYFVQAVNGVGLVSLDTNQGAYYIPMAETDPADQLPTQLLFDPQPSSSGAYGSQPTFSAILTSEGTPLANQIVRFGIGSQTLHAITDSNGQATVNMPLLGLPGQYELTATFAPTRQYADSTVSSPFEIKQQSTAIALAVETGQNGQPEVVATLTDAADHRLLEQTIIFVVTGDSGSFAASVITNLIGEATLRNIPLPGGDYTVTAYFAGSIPIPGQGVVTLPNSTYIPSSRSTTVTLPAAVGSIKIVKAVRDSGIVNAFSFTGDLGEFSLTSNSTYSATTFANLPPGTYQVSEDRTSFPAGNWALLDVSCLDVTDSTMPTMVPVVEDLKNYTAEIPLAGGQKLVCTFLNERTTGVAEDDSQNVYQIFLPNVTK